MAVDKRELVRKIKSGEFQPSSLKENTPCKPKPPSPKIVPKLNRGNLAPGTKLIYKDKAGNTIKTESVGANGGSSLFSGTGLGKSTANTSSSQNKPNLNYESSALFTSNRKASTATILTHTPEMVNLNFVQKELLEVISELEIVKMRYKDDNLIEQIKRLKRLRTVSIA